MGRDSNRQRSSKDSSDKRRREREEQERRERDRHRRERETSDRERRETDERERDRLRRERRERDSDSHRMSGREDLENRSERQREERKRTERRDKERHEREEESRESYERKGQKKETHRHESEETRERPESWAERMDAFAQQLQRHERESIGPQTSSDSRVTSTYIPPRTVSQTEESYTESTYSSSTGATQRIIDIPIFRLPFPPQFGLQFPPQYGWPVYAPQYSGSASQITSNVGRPPIVPPIAPSISHISERQYRSSLLRINPVISDPQSQRMDVQLSHESNWYSNRNVWPVLIYRKPQTAGIIGKASYNRLFSKKDVFDRNHIIFINYSKRFAVEESVDPIRWYLYIDRMLHTGYQLTAEMFALQHFREFGRHIIVNKSNLLLSLHFGHLDRVTNERTVLKPIAINSVIPFCRNGNVCYGMQIVNNTGEGLRFWWFGYETDTIDGFYEMYDSFRYENRLRFFKVSEFYTGILLHNDAKLMFRDPTYRHYEKGHELSDCETLYCGATFIIFERKFAVFIESEQILVSLEDLFNCGAIADITVLNHALLLLQEIQSQTNSAVWSLNLDRVETSPIILLNRRIVLRIPDRNAISYMWYWNSDFKDGLKYVEWYQSITDWSTKFEFESHPFAQPFAGTPKPEMEPKKLWLGTDPQNWLLQSTVHY